MFNVLPAPLAALALNLTAICAAISLGPDAHPGTCRRCTAALNARVFTLLVASRYSDCRPDCLPGQGCVVRLLAGERDTDTDTDHGVPVPVTFLVTTSSMMPVGIGSASWELLPAHHPVRVLPASTAGNTCSSCRN